MISELLFRRNRRFGRDVGSRRSRTRRVFEHLEHRLCLAALGVLYADGMTVNELEDEDFEILLEQNNNGILEVDEFVGGVIKIQQLLDVDPGVQPFVGLQSAPDTFTGLFLFEVAVAGDGLAGTLGVETLSLGPASQAAWTATFGLGGPVDLGGARSTPCCRTREQWRFFSTAYGTWRQPIGLARSAPRPLHSCREDGCCTNWGLPAQADCRRRMNFGAQRG